MRKRRNDAPLPDRRDPHWDELPWERRRRLAEEERKVEEAIKVELETRLARQKIEEEQRLADRRKAEAARRLYEKGRRLRTQDRYSAPEFLDIGGDGSPDAYVDRRGDRYVVRNMKGEILYTYDDIWEQGS